MWRNQVIVAGIDYSLTSPSVCVHAGTSWDVANCKFYYLVKRAKSVVTDGQFYGAEYPEFSNDQHRHDNLAQWSLKILLDNRVEEAFLEGYAFGATGRVFHIAENTGHLKYTMWRHKIPFDVYTPSAIKKFASGKGNANKEKMYEAFLAETGVDIRRKLDIMSEKQWNPISDIADAYYIAKMGHATLTSLAPIAETP